MKCFCILSVPCCLFAACGSTAASITYEYTGRIRALTNLDDAPISEETPVSIEFTFDPATPDTNSSAAVGNYQFSGGETSFQMTVGEFESEPLDEFNVTVWTEGCCASEDLYLFLERPGVGLTLNFPGLAEEVGVALRFINRRTPIISDDLFVTQPNPADYSDETAVFVTRPSPSRLRFGIELDPIGPRVPEPTGTSLSLLGVVTWLASRPSTKKARHTP